MRSARSRSRRMSRANGSGRAGWLSTATPGPGRAPSRGLAGAAAVDDETTVGSGDGTVDAAGWSTAGGVARAGGSSTTVGRISGVGAARGAREAATTNGRLLPVHARSSITTSSPSSSVGVGSVSGGVSSLAGGGGFSSGVSVRIAGASSSSISVLAAEVPLGASPPPPR